MRGAAAARRLLSDGSGAVADLGILIPIATTLIVKNGLDAGTVLVGAGALYVVAGLYFKVPVPVQPIKAAAAIAIARNLPPATIAAAGVVLGLVLVILSATGGAKLLSRIFTKPIVRGVQLGVGLLLLRSALHLPRPPVSTSVWIAAAGAAIILVSSARKESRPLALALVLAGVVWSLAGGNHHVALRPHLWRASILGDVFRPSILWSALTLLVIPQIPLTFGNAVVALTDLERRYFGAQARRVSPGSISLSCGIANMTVGALGGMPMCHGSGGLTAHYRAGARSYRMNLMIGVPLLILGLVFGPTAFSVLTLIPIAVLVGLLAFAGTMHSLLVSDLRGYDLGVAVAMGAVGLWTSNLSVSLALGLVLVWAPAASASLYRRAKGLAQA